MSDHTTRGAGGSLEDAAPPGCAPSKQIRTVRSDAITAAEGWTAGSCTASTPSTAPESKPFVFGVIPPLVYPLESATLCCRDAITLESAMGGVEQILEVCIAFLV